MPAHSLEPNAVRRYLIVLILAAILPLAVFAGSRAHGAGVLTAHGPPGARQGAGRG